MTVDVFTRMWIGPDPWPGSTSGRTPPRQEASPEAHRAAMHCVDAAIVVGFRADRLGIHQAPEQLAAFVNAEPDRRVGFAGVDPLSPSLRADLDKAAGLGLSGVAVACADSGCRPTHDGCMHLFDWCARHGFPVVFTNPALHDPRSNLEFAQPVLLDEALRAFPRLRAVHADFGLFSIEESLTLIARHPGLYASLNGIAHAPAALRHALVLAHERGLTHKLLFASGFPRELPERAIERLYGLAGPISGGAGLPREALRSIVERHALEALGLESAPAAALARRARELRADDDESGEAEAVERAAAWSRS